MKNVSEIASEPNLHADPPPHGVKLARRNTLVSFKGTALERSLIRRRARIWSAATGIREFFEAIFTRLATMRSETAVSLAAQTGVVE